MNKFHWDLVIWLPWFLLFVVLELTAVFWKGCPWSTLSRFGWDLEDWSDWFRILFFAGLGVLLVHICWGFPGRGLP